MKEQWRKINQLFYLKFVPLLSFFHFHSFLKFIFIVSSSDKKEMYECWEISHHQQKEIESLLDRISRVSETLKQSVDIGITKFIAETFTHSPSNLKKRLS